jgi:hypothetical protein
VIQGLGLRRAPPDTPHRPVTPWNPIINDIGEFMAKPNYNYARRQRELTRKARQQDKRKDKPVDTVAAVEIAAVVAPGESVAAGTGLVSGSGV